MVSLSGKTQVIAWDARMHVDTAVRVYLGTGRVPFRTRMRVPSEPMKILNEADREC